MEEEKFTFLYILSSKMLSVFGTGRSPKIREPRRDL